MKSLIEEGKQPLVDIYCLTYNNPQRKKSMMNRFNRLGMSEYMYDGVGPEDPRIKEHELSSCMLGHMDMIAKFYNESDKEFGIFCEDDILIHNELMKNIPAIIEKCKKHEYDLVLLGYLMNYHIHSEGLYGHFFLSELSSNPHHKFYTYSDETWGTQMYMISKTYAKELLENYGMSYALNWKAHENKEESNPYTCYFADWIITKKTKKRALIFPPFCIENGDVDHYTHYGQRTYHKASYTMHVNEHFI